ncbi:MAG TPA: DNA replication and repair protein RecF [Candidatus Saccharimonadales bacterium]|nr:DNA replication and repair protein RecF [Candidatus Saccharimonadales bacterium]
MISEVRLQHFRSYTDARYSFSPQVNIIVGPNASGKTNLLEAVLVLARGSSYRAKDGDLIAFGEPWARLDALADEEARTVKLVAEPLPMKSYDIGGKPFKRLSLQHSLPVVLFEPNHLQLLHGSPDQRRNYLDDLLEQLTPGYSGYRRNYRRVLSHRNALLKRSRLPSNEELFPWNLRLSELGAVMSRARAALVARANEQLDGLYKDMSGVTTTVAMKYHHHFPLETYESRLLHRLESELSTDLMRGFTAAGPHREDFELYFNDTPADETASRGETRTAILALKVIELQELATARGQTPLLLLDDVFSELDASRRAALTAHLQPYQTFITTTDADVTARVFKKHATTITLGAAL